MGTLVLARSRCGSVASFVAAYLALAAWERWLAGTGVLSGSREAFWAQLFPSLAVAIAIALYFSGVFPPSCRLKLHFPKLPTVRGRAAVSVHQPFAWLAMNGLLTRGKSGAYWRKRIALRMGRDTIVAVEYALDAGFETVTVRSYLLNPEKKRRDLADRVTRALPGVRVEQVSGPIGWLERRLLAFASCTDARDFPRTEAGLRFSR